MGPQQWQQPGAPPQFTNPVPSDDTRNLLMPALIVVATLAVLAIAAASYFLVLTPLRASLKRDAANTASYPPADGSSDMPGGGVSIFYTPSAGLHEYRSFEPPDGTVWGVASHDHFSIVSLDRISVPPLDTHRAIARFIAFKNRQNSGLAGFNVKAKSVVLNGYHGYEWQYIYDREDTWVRNWWFPGRRYSYRLQCMAYIAEREQFRALCGEAARSLHITAR